jgi:DNA-binding CsgD family transcriptional regulator
VVLQNDKVIVFHGAYSGSLETINGIKLAPREIDILACVLMGSAIKTIASFLSLSHKTVEAHTRALMRKLGSDSRGNLIACIEKSGKASLLKKRYRTVFIQATFEQQLQKISILALPKSAVCRLVDMREKKDKLSVFHQLEKHLERGGIKISSDSRDGQKFAVDSSRRGSQERNHTLYIVSQGQVAQLQAKNSTILLGSDFSTVLLLDRNISTTISNETNDTCYINVGNQENYYFSVFEILKRIFPDIPFDKIITAFKKQDEQMHNFSDSAISLWPRIKVWIQQKQGLRKLLRKILQNKVAVTIFCFSVLSCVLEQRIKRSQAAQQLAQQPDLLILSHTNTHRQFIAPLLVTLPNGLDLDIYKEELPHKKSSQLFNNASQLIFFSQRKIFYSFFSRG